MEPDHEVATVSPEPDRAASQEEEHLVLRFADGRQYLVDPVDAAAVLLDHLVEPGDAAAVLLDHLVDPRDAAAVLLDLFFESFRNGEVGVVRLLDHLVIVTMDPAAYDCGARIQLPIHGKLCISQSTCCTTSQIGALLQSLVIRI